jgi:hypothetical protein
MAAIDSAMVSKLLNQTTPTGAAGIPGSFGTALSSSAMKVRLNSTASTGAAAGTEIASGGGYVTGGTALANASTVSSAGSAVTLPATAALTWTNSSGGAWSIVSMDLTDNAGVRCWFGNFNGQPISIAVSNSFQIAIGGVSISLT